MYKVLLVLASAAALKRPERALKVRGGELGLNADTAIQVGTWITGLSGAMAYVDPKGNLENYGITTAQASGIDNMRWAGANQLTLAAIFAADPEQAVGLSGYYAAWNLIASAPATKAVGFPDWCIYGWAAVCAVLGKKTLSGDVSPWALVAVWGLNGIQQVVKSIATIFLMFVTKPSEIPSRFMNINILYIQSEPNGIVFPVIDVDLRVLTDQVLDNQNFQGFTVHNAIGEGS